MQHRQHRIKCPESRRKRGAEVDSCKLTEGICALEQGNTCSVYEEYLKEVVDESIVE